MKSHCIYGSDDCKKCSNTIEEILLLKAKHPSSDFRTDLMNGIDAYNQAIEDACDYLKTKKWNN